MMAPSPGSINKGVMAMKDERIQDPALGSIFFVSLASIFWRDTLTFSPVFSDKGDTKITTF